MTWAAVSDATILLLVVFPMIGAATWSLLRLVPPQGGQRLLFAILSYFPGVAAGFVWSLQIHDVEGDSRILFVAIGLPIMYAIGLPLYLVGYAAGRALARKRIRYNPTGRFTLRIEKVR